MKSIEIATRRFVGEIVPVIRETILAEVDLALVTKRRPPKIRKRRTPTAMKPAAAVVAASTVRERLLGLMVVGWDPLTSQQLAATILAKEPSIRRTLHEMQRDGIVTQQPMRDRPGMGWVRLRTRW